MTKKLYKDAIFVSHETAANELATMRANIAEVFGTDILTTEGAFKTNLPNVEIDGETFPALGLDEENNLVFSDPESIGNLGLVTIYEGEARPDPEQPPLAVPRVVYLVNLPTTHELTTDKKLSGYLEALVKKDQLTRARAIAKRDHEQKAPLVADRVAQLIAAAASTSGNATEKAYRVMFPTLQNMIVKQATSAADRMKQAGKAAQARMILAVYSRQRVSRDTLKECFQSAEAAAHHFPQMPQEQWITILRAAAQLAPSCPVSTIVKDDEGNTVKDAEGKAVRKVERVALSPAFFLDCIATRDQRALELDEAPAISFEGMTM